MIQISKASYNDEELFLIQGESGYYIVKLESGQYSCTCPYYQYHKSICKHIAYVVLNNEVEKYD